MLIELEEIEFCKLNINVELDPEQVKEKKTEVVQLFKGASVPGFRPGKATLAAIKHHFKDKIEEKTKSELAQIAFNLTLAEKNITPFGPPKFNSMLLENDKFNCNFNLNKIPEIELKQYKGFEIPNGHIPNAVEMAEKIIQELRNRNGTTLPFDDNDFIQTGDTAIINYKGFLANQVEPAIEKDGELFVVGEADVQGFNENLLGMKVGEKREFTILMPPDSSARELASQEVKYVLELGMASKSIPAPLNDELANKIGAKNADEMIQLTQGIAASRVKELERNHLKEQVSLRLVDNNEFDVPDWLCKFEAELIARRYGYSWNDLTDPNKQELLKVAKNNVKLSIILNKIRQVEPEAQMSDEEVFSAIKINVGKYRSMLPNMADKTDEEVLQYIQYTSYMPIIVSSIKDDFTFDFVINNCSIIQ